MKIGVVANSLFLLFVMIAVGFLAGKAKWVREEASQDFTAFLMNVTLPCTIFHSMLRPYDAALMRDGLLLFLLGLLFFAGGMILVRQIAKGLRIRTEIRNVWVLCVSLCNTGFMGFPLVEALFGEEGLFLAAMMNLAYNITAFSLGVKIICSGSENQGKISGRKMLLTKNNAALLLGLLCFLSQISLPAPVVTLVEDFAGITTPLSMFLIGLSLSSGSIAAVFRDRDVRSITGMRLVVMPLLCLFILKILPLPEGSLVEGVGALIMAMPCPSLAMIFAQEYGGDVPLAARAIFLSSLCCIVTIPLLMLLL